MTSLYFDECCSIDYHGETLSFHGNLGYANLPKIEKKLLLVIKSCTKIEAVDFSGLDAFDTALIVMLCRLRPIMLKHQEVQVVWIIPEKLDELLSLYGIHEFFTTKR